jgi:hypothetical protein
VSSRTVDREVAKIDARTGLIDDHEAADTRMHERLGFKPALTIARDLLRPGRRSRFMPWHHRLNKARRWDESDCRGYVPGGDLGAAAHHRGGVGATPRIVSERSMTAGALCLDPRHQPA